MGLLLLVLFVGLLCCFDLGCCVCFTCGLLVGFIGFGLVLVCVCLGRFTFCLGLLVWLLVSLCLGRAGGGVRCLGLFADVVLCLV